MQRRAVIHFVDRAHTDQSVAILPLPIQGKQLLDLFRVPDGVLAYIAGYRNGKPHRAFTRIEPAREYDLDNSFCWEVYSPDRILLGTCVL